MLKEKFFFGKISVILSFHFGNTLCIKRIFVLDRSFYLRKIYHYLSYLIICVKPH